MCLQCHSQDGHIALEVGRGDPAQQVAWINMISIISVP